MSELQTFDCEECGTDFKAAPGANAARRGYCSPACESAGEGLA